ncbi:pyroglutamyl-peptidase I family protein [Myceligenerans salitolerans]|uniref:Pyroglutamyl-peptidase I n=1 Tax=Myceligenerans salitolerans TaxID=1230528 RepID=A0ABS3IBQ5_9MICO|nr:pyroglutamyl-peptidase I [Myceligenerans salitolerans]MBO0610467.1 pyroglutamyl-peptidase I [Myceligenerans salitolerans]
MRALVTGFEPFGGDGVNASAEAVKRLAATWGAASGRAETGGAALDTLLLPVTFGGAFAPVREAVLAAQEEGAPYDVVVGVGLAAQTDVIRLERVAINVADARIPDNAGHVPADEPLVDAGPAAHFTGLPVKAALAGLREAGIPAVVSNTAGTFVCNALFYALRDAFGDGVTGFVHVPRMTEEAVDGDPGLPLDTLAAALRIVLTTSLAAARGEQQEKAMAAGAEH